MPDGPIEELLDVLEQLRADPGSMTAVVEELAELKRKLPAELTPRPRRPAARRAPNGCEPCLGQVQPLLLDLLLKSQGGDAKADAK